EKKTFLLPTTIMPPFTIPNNRYIFATSTLNMRKENSMYIIIEDVVISNDHESHPINVWKVDYSCIKSHGIDVSKKWKHVHTLVGHLSDINSIINLKDSVIASCSDDTTIRLWDLKTGNCDAILIGHKHRVHRIYILSHRYIVGISKDIVRIW